MYTSTLQFVHRGQAYTLREGDTLIFLGGVLRIRTGNENVGFVEAGSFTEELALGYSISAFVIAPLIAASAKLSTMCVTQNADACEYTYVLVRRNRKNPA